MVSSFLRCIVFSCSIIFSRLSLAFTPCPLLGPVFPEFALDTNSEVLGSALDDLTEAFDTLVKDGNGSHGDVHPNTTSFSLSLFSTNQGDAADTPFLFKYHYTAPSLKSSPNAAHDVDKDSIYRIGGLTKVFTVWSILIETGDRIWNEPVTKYVPELAKAAKCLDAKQDPVSYVNWEDVTIGQLASHLAGIAREYGVGDLSEQTDHLEYGLPPLSASEVPGCNLDSLCGRAAEFFSHFSQQPPVALPGTTPIYSNAEFQILGYAIESITGKSFESVLQDHILGPLGMEKTSLSTPANSSSAVIPVDEETSGWSTQYGGEAPAISMFSSITDLSIAGKAILASTLLSQSQTNRWLKPTIHTSNPANSIGYPWVIYSGGNYPNTSMVDVYTALSDVGLYSSYIGLVPDFNVGFTILAADSVSSPDLNAHADIIADMALPALMKIAVLQADASFGGVYASSRLNSTITVSADSLPGLFIDTFISNGTDFRQVLATFNGIDEADALRLFFKTEMSLLIMERGTCVSWMDIDSFKYDGASLDQFIFELDKNGNALSVEIPALRVELERGD
ncbi:hypothetical protein AJ80_09012 [Polytolypa hystricis UAMH7299]|uniref:Uncharacterized protein n=1 Tax=Polytolypa hystricis (strain UAMH7299) TaxID=1447883 RepID=A0A2B7WY40_POLH7|nr:hypothetical protein AJ80_09012 [Polytolypa hystricis UAMH7299]